jgi:transcription termination factor Rho
VSQSGKELADRYVKAKPPTPRPSFETLYPARPARSLHVETKTHVSGGVNRIEYELVEDRERRVLVVAPYNASKATRLRAIARARRPRTGSMGESTPLEPAHTP